MPHFIHTKDDLESAIAELVTADPRLAPVFAVAGPPPLRRRLDYCCPAAFDRECFGDMGTIERKI